MTYGGSFGKGAVVAVSREASGLLKVTTLHSFSGPDGENPESGLIQADDGSFYGTAGEGGANGLGLVFKIAANGAFAPLHSFVGPDGAHPDGALLQARDGFFYGTTADVVPSGSTTEISTGTVFRMDATGNVTVLHTFSGPDGASPQGALVQDGAGDLWGTTAGGGEPGAEVGTVFKMTAAGALTTVYAFPTSGPFHPSPLLLQATDGNFYGSTLQTYSPSGGTTIYRVTSTGAVDFLHTFTAAEGLDARVLTQGRDGNLYGLTDLAAFRMTPGGTVTVLRAFHTFEGRDGASLVQAADGRLYGAMTTQGPAARGSFFGMTLAGQLTSLTGFYDLSPLFSAGRLLQASDGNFYGTSCQGGVWNLGTVFRMTPAGDVTTLHSFFYWNGACPIGGLILGDDGWFYGTAAVGGASDAGTVFRVSTSGAVAVLHVFTGADGNRPTAGLVRGSDGKMYGTTYRGGAYDTGTVFSIDSTGAFSLLHSFTTAAGDGRNPFGGVVEASDGNFYGTTTGGGPGANGCVFRMTRAGAVTLFALPPGSSHPYGDLIQAADGSLYGTTFHGGVTGMGSVFKIDLLGNSTLVHALEETDIAHPYGGLTQGTDGVLYGTTYGGPTELCETGFGSVFGVKPTGELTLLRPFAGTDGACPVGGVTQGADGALYGTALMGGPGQRGVVFKLDPVP